MSMATELEPPPKVAEVPAEADAAAPSAGEPDVAVAAVAVAEVEAEVEVEAEAAHNPGLELQSQETTDGLMIEVKVQEKEEKHSHPAVAPIDSDTGTRMTDDSTIEGRPPVEGSADGRSTARHSPFKLRCHTLRCNPSLRNPFPSLLMLRRSSSCHPSLVILRPPFFFKWHTSLAIPPLQVLRASVTWEGLQEDDAPRPPAADGEAGSAQAQAAIAGTHAHASVAEGPEPDAETTEFLHVARFGVCRTAHDMEVLHGNELHLARQACPPDPASLGSPQLVHCLLERGTLTLVGVLK